ncbi:spore germination protein KC [Natronobacillus azotifigens]|uniref:Ger(X)C family spore germination protein n=1 Tax=Natronobacillus azotifigens TaxID=472978 RepID=A0A9J6R8R6_9BACI|nr:Ger(x)C family spore germination protein [Natronobacillus azotifigens]MCZ0701707.1 Ger(x)C family spore germination protein [Natronobacillus azotifigens]
MKYNFYLLLFVVLFFLTGCWSSVEINDNAFVTAVFIDQGKDGNVELTLGFPLPSRMVPGNLGGQVEGNIYTTVTHEAENVAAAYRKIQSDITRHISWGHTRIIVFSEEFAKNGVYEPLEFFSRQPAFHSKSLVLIAPGKAIDITKLTPAFERFPAEVLHKFIQQEVTVRTTVADFLRVYYYGGNMLAPMLTVGEEPMLSEEQKVRTWVGTGGAALFRKGKMVDELSEQDMRGALWFERITRESVITIDSFTDGKPISIIVLDSVIKKNPIIKENNQLGFQLEIKVKDDLLSVDSEINISDPSTLTKLEVEIAKALEDRIQSAFQKTQEIGADVFNLGEYFEWYHPNEWKELKDDWPEHYKNIELESKITIKIKRPGATKRPLWEENR